MAYLGDLDPTAHFGPKVGHLVQQLSYYRYEAKDLKALADQITTGGTTNWAALETAFGLPSGSGAAWYPLLQAVVAALEPAGVPLGIFTGAR